MSAASGLSASARLLQSITSRWGGGTVSYTRGSTTVQWSGVSFGKSMLASDETMEARVETESTDFIGPSAGIVPTFSVPAQGDIIGVTLANTLRTYEVMSPPYRPSDSSGTNIRVHAKLTSIY